MKQQHEELQTSIRRMESAINAVSRSLSGLSSTVSNIQIEVQGSRTTADSVQRLQAELARLESAIKEHLSGHVGILSESLIGRGGFWKGVWLLIGVQAIGWVIYEIYRNKRRHSKKFL
jgi:hypothetical protein